MSTATCPFLEFTLSGNLRMWCGREALEYEGDRMEVRAAFYDALDGAPPGTTLCTDSSSKGTGICALSLTMATVKE